VDFEVVLDMEESTSIDVLLTHATGARTIIEVKLTERSFGRTRADSRHIAKLTNVYRPRLSGRIADECLEPRTFFTSYQLFRSLAQIRPESADRLLLLMPRARSGLWQHSTAWSQAARLHSLGRQVALIAVEDVIRALSSDSTSPAMPNGFADEIADKYSLVDQPALPADGVRTLAQETAPRLKRHVASSVAQDSAKFSSIHASSSRSASGSRSVGARPPRSSSRQR
jgi:hypothetical protein